MKLQIQENYIDAEIAIRTEDWDFYFALDDFFNCLITTGRVKYIEGEGYYFVEGDTVHALPELKSIIEYIVQKDPLLIIHVVQRMMIKTAAIDYHEFEIEHKKPISF